MEIPWKEVFAPDSGTLLNIRVYDTTVADYERLLGMLAKQYRILYLEDGNAIDPPDYAAIIRRRDVVSVSIAIDVVGVQVNCFFWGENELTLDLLPEDVDSAEKAQGVFDLMKAIAAALNKHVLLTAENASATRQWSEEYAICMFAPLTSNSNCCNSPPRKALDSGGGTPDTGSLHPVAEAVTSSLDRGAFFIALTPVNRCHLLK